METVTFAEVTKAIGDVGIMLVISAIVVYALIRGLNILFNRFDNKSYRQEHDELLQTRSCVDEAIQEDIYDYLENHNTHRVQVIEFSNSVTSVTYLPFKYASCTYEVFDIDQTSRAYNIDKITTSLFTPFLRSLYNKPYIDLDEANADVKTYGGAIYDLLKRCKESRGLFVMIKSHNNKSVGFVAAYKDDKFTDDEVSDLEAMAIRLSAQLCIIDNSKKAGK